MIIIGEKINGFIPSTLKAIEGKDEEYLKGLARSQTEFGAAYIDVCAGVEPAIERDTMKWLIGLVQSVVETPLCIDSSDVDVIIDMIPLANKPGMINSVSGEEGKCDKLFPVIADSAWNVVALTCDQDGIPEEPEKKFEIATRIVDKAASYGISVDRLYIDPLVTTLATKPNSLTSFSAAVRLIKEKYPDIHITSGLSNISYGMPYRKVINQAFLQLAMAAGMDSAIIDPTAENMRAAIYATEVLLEQDPACKRFLKAYRQGLIGNKKA